MNLLDIPVLGWCLKLYYKFFPAYTDYAGYYCTEYGCRGVYRSLTHKENCDVDENLDEQVICDLCKKMRERYVLIK